MEGYILLYACFRYVASHHITGCVGYWMSDKALVQQALASDLAQLLLSISNVPSSLYFLRGFWSAIIREWSGLDYLRCVNTGRSVAYSSYRNKRMDKFYMLVRRFVNASFRLLVREKWAENICVEYNEILTRPGGPLT